MNDDLISRSELKKHKFTTTIYNGIEPENIEVVPVATIDNAPTVDTYTEDDVQEAIKAGYQVGYELPKAKFERPQGKWIPVSERLPEDMQRVLIWFEYYRYGDYNCMYQTYGFGYVCDGKWSPFINGETGWQDTRIIAWMPLPEAYKEVEKDGH